MYGPDGFEGATGVASGNAVVFCADVVIAVAIIAVIRAVNGLCIMSTVLIGITSGRRRDYLEKLCGAMEITSPLITDHLMIRSRSGSISFGTVKHRYVRSITCCILARQLI
jgi:hypothetical protein